jgi:hypothetical protein
MEQTHDNFIEFVMIFVDRFLSNRRVVIIRSHIRQAFGAVKEFHVITLQALIIICLAPYSALVGP